MRSELQLKRRSTDIKVPLDGVFDYCQDFNNSGWFQKSRTRLVDGYCFRRVDTNINKNSNRLSSVFIATGEFSVCVCVCVLVINTSFCVRELGGSPKRWFAVPRTACNLRFPH